jgi:hypothetical protein
MKTTLSSKMGCVAVRGGAWQCVAVCGSAWQCVAVSDSALLKWSVWQCVAVRGSTSYVLFYVLCLIPVDAD